MPIKYIEIMKVLERARVSQEVGPGGFVLLAVIALREDELRDSWAPNFWMAELKSICGFKSDGGFRKCRDKCVELGYLEYNKSHRKIGEYRIGPKILYNIERIAAPLQSQDDRNGTVTGQQPDRKRAVTEPHSIPTLSSPNEEGPANRSLEISSQNSEEFIEFWSWLNGAEIEKYDKIDSDYKGDMKIRNDDIQKREDIYLRCISLANDNLGYLDIADIWIKQLRLEYYHRNVKLGIWYLKSFLSIMVLPEIQNLLVISESEIDRIHNERFETWQAETLALEAAQ